MDRIDKDEELVCPLCGGRLFWMPVSHIYACEHCKQSYSERNGVYMKKKRKSTAEKSSAVGDVAKLREALSDACYAMFNFLKAQNGGYEEIANALDKAKAALAAPPRNCDVIGNTGRALLVHGFPTKSNQWGEGEWLEFIDWLLAPATEKKGGDDADK